MAHEGKARTGAEEQTPVCFASIMAGPPSVTAGDQVNCKHPIVHYSPCSRAIHYPFSPVARLLPLVSLKPVITVHITCPVQYMTGLNVQGF